ncbi:hypothetical protein HEK131_21690 [Streptomyces seoulensis]|nr:hypothetical protein HEK131_21690 [Streptomyces seoulensis]
MLTPAQRLDHLGGQAAGPGEELVVAGDVVQVQHRCPAERGGQVPGEGGLPGARVSVDADQPDRPQGGGEAAQTAGEVVNGDS